MSGQLTVRVTPGPVRVLVMVAGDCDATTGRQFRDALMSQVPRGASRMIVDLSGLAFMDSAGAHVMVNLKTVLTARGGSLVLVSPQPIVARVLSLMGVDELIPVVTTLAEALTLG